MWNKNKTPDRKKQKQKKNKRRKSWNQKFLSGLDLIACNLIPINKNRTDCVKSLSISSIQLNETWSVAFDNCNAYGQRIVLHIGQRFHDGLKAWISR